MCPEKTPNVARVKGKDQMRNSRDQNHRADNRFIRDTHPRSPDLIERVVHQPCSRVRKSSVLPAKNDSDVSGEILLGAVDISDVDNPDSN